MSTKIYPISMGIMQCYIIQENGTIMVDGGTPKKVSKFVKAVEKLPLEPDEIKLIVVTHKHYDHIASVKEIRDVTGARIAMHRDDKEWLEKAIPHSPPPGVTSWGRFLIRMLRSGSVEIPTTDVDVVLDDREFSLAEYGVSGKIVHTPGHTSGSVSVLLETGEVFVGDLAMNGFPLRLRPGLPIFAEDIEKARESWKTLLDQGAKTVYPGHGKPFSADAIRRELGLN